MNQENVGESNDNSNKEAVGKKRTDCISWNEYFMFIAALSAERSKDPSTQVGACIVNEKNEIVGVGYNGMPRGLSDDEMPWGKDGDDPLQTKYFYVVHAELKAILSKNCVDLTNCTLYTTLFPCNECAKSIIQSGIKEVIYLSKLADEKQFEASRTMLGKMKVTMTPFELTRKKITLDLESRK